MSRVQSSLLLLLLAGGSAFGADPPPWTPRILFVHLRVNDGGFSVLDTTNAPGLLKVRRAPAARRDFELVLEEGGGREPWRQSLTDPRIRRFEYEDPGQPGTLKVREIRVAEAECVVRMPDLPGKRRLAIYRSRKAAGAGAQAPSVRELVGHCELPERSDR